MTSYKFVDLRCMILNHHFKNKTDLMVQVIVQGKQTRNTRGKMKAKTKKKIALQLLIRSVKVFKNNKE